MTNDDELVCPDCKKTFPWSVQCVHRDPEIQKAKNSVLEYKPFAARASNAAQEREKLMAQLNQKATPTLMAAKDLEVKQTEALVSLSTGVNQIAQFLTGGGLAKLLNSYAMSQAAKDILGGLAAHDGRAALDARTLAQNALEITEQVFNVFDKFQERLQSKEKRDPEIHDAEADFNKRK